MRTGHRTYVYSIFARSCEEQVRHPHPTTRSFHVRFRTAIATALSLCASVAGAVEVHSYASQVNDVDSVNSHWFETGEGVVLIDAQRLLPEAERMLDHLRSTTDSPIVAVIVTHAHTDLYGGLPAVLDAFPEARVLTDATTLQSLREDGRGYIDMRNERHGERFASRERLTAAASDAEVVEQDQEMSFGDETLRFHVVGPSEAEATLMVDVLEEDVTSSVI